MVLRQRLVVRIGLALGWRPGASPMSGSASSIAVSLNTRLAASSLEVVPMLASNSSVTGSFGSIELSSTTPLICRMASRASSMLAMRRGSTRRPAKVLQVALLAPPLASVVVCTLSSRCSAVISVLQNVAICIGEQMMKIGSLPPRCAAPSPVRLGHNVHRGIPQLAVHQRFDQHAGAGRVRRTSIQCRKLTIFDADFEHMACENETTPICYSSRGITHVRMRVPGGSGMPASSPSSKLLSTTRR